MKSFIVVGISAVQFASSVLGIGGKYAPKLLDASKDSKYDSMPLF